MIKSTLFLVISLLFSSVFTGQALLLPKTEMMSSMSQQLHHSPQHQSQSQSFQSSAGAESDDKPCSSHLTQSHAQHQNVTDCEQQCQASHCMSNSYFTEQATLVWPLQQQFVTSIYLTNPPLYHPNSLYRPPIAS